MEPTKFSVYKPPITNVMPYGQRTMAKIFEGISTKLVDETYRCRQLIQIHGKESKKVNGIEKNKFRCYKAEKLPFATFAGTFSERRTDGLIKASGYYCLDLDNIPEPDAVRDQILQIDDPYFKTCLLFTSPSGCGLKWIITIEPNDFDYSENFIGLCGYVKEKYQLNPDNTPDIARACFLCYDPNAYYNENIRPYTLD